MSTANVSWCRWSPRAYSGETPALPAPLPTTAGVNAWGKRRPERRGDGAPILLHGGDVCARRTELCVPSSAAVSACRPVQEFQAPSCRRSMWASGMPFSSPPCTVNRARNLPIGACRKRGTVAGTKAQINVDVSRAAVRKGDAFRRPSRRGPVHPGGRSRSPIVAALSDPTGRWTQP